METSSFNGLCHGRVDFAHNSLRLISLTYLARCQLLGRIQRAISNVPARGRQTFRIPVATRDDATGGAPTYNWNRIRQSSRLIQHTFDSAVGAFIGGLPASDFSWKRPMRKSPSFIQAPTRVQVDGDVASFSAFCGSAVLETASSSPLT